MVTDTREVPGVIILREQRRWPNRFPRDTQHIGHAIHDHSDQATLDRDNQVFACSTDRVVFHLLRCERRQLEALAHVNDRQDRSTQLDDTFNEGRCPGNPRDLQRVDDFFDPHDVERVFLVANAETTELHDLIARLVTLGGLATLTKAPAQRSSRLITSSRNA